MKKFNFINILITLIIALILYYFMLPPINITSPMFYLYTFIVFGIFIVLSSISSIEYIIKGRKVKDFSFYLIFLIPIGIIGIILINFVLSPLFFSKSYANRIYINEDSDFSKDIAEVDFKQLPLLDKDSSRKLGDRVMGQMPELVSQFTVSNLYTQINFNDEIMRVTPLEYNSWIKYLSNRKDGVKGYITVNSVSGEANLVKLEKGMKYMPSSLFFENLDRHIRIKYPTEIFEEKYFEIDNEGNPYWIIPTITYKGIGIRKTITGIITVNPINGKTKKYNLNEIPTWIDHVYSAELIIEQVDDWGQYKNGYLNSIFGQKNVVQTTTGYNYLVMNDDVYMYTGITSVVNDESNIGFILTNLRTKETKFYSIPGAEEYSAMASAEGQVQNMKYTSTFPLLINLNNRPTYLVSLKDNAGLVKMYGLIDVKDYQKVVVSDASKGIENAVNNYINNTELEVDEESLKTEEIVIKKINTGVLEGNTIYYLKDTNNKKYSISLKDGKNILPFLEVNQKVTITYDKNSSKEVIEIISIK